MHLLGEIQGRPSDEFLQDMGLRCCQVCGRSISQRYASGIHPFCWPRKRDVGIDRISFPQHAVQLSSLFEIFIAPIFTKDQLPSELWPLIREEYGKLLAAVTCTSRPDAWDPLPVLEGGRNSGDDCLGKQQARQAWLELLMFPKAVLRQNKRGQRRGQALMFTKSLLLRWRLGERRELWDEAKGRVVQTKRGSMDDNREHCREGVHADVRRLVSLGRPGRAWRHALRPLRANFSLSSPLILGVDRSVRRSLRPQKSRTPSS